MRSVYIAMSIKMTFMTTLKRLLYRTSGLIIKGAKYNPKQIKSNNIDAKSVAISQHEDSIAIEAKGNLNKIMQATKKISELTDADKKIVVPLEGLPKGRLQIIAGLYFFGQNGYPQRLTTTVQQDFVVIMNSLEIK